MLNLVSDSSCDLISGELNSPYARLTVAPMCLHVGGQDYLDTPELDIPALLSKLAHHRSSSACPSPAAYAEAFEQGEETVCVTISSQLSGSYNAAMAARDLVLAEHPEKKIFVLDSRATSYDPAAAEGR
jgi:fatty acid-binding protein DegV